MEELGPTREAESAEETLRVTAVETAWGLIARHPNWYRRHGFAVGEDWGPEFLASMREIKHRIEARVERQRALEFSTGREPALPNTLDAIVTAVFLLRSGRRPVRPIPSGIGATWRALLPFCVEEIEQARAGAPATKESDETGSAVFVEAEGWSVDLEALRRPERLH